MFPALQLIIQLVVAILTGYMYYRTISTLKQMHQCERKKLIVRSFALLWLAWAITSFPHAIFDAVFGRYVFKDFMGRTVDLNTNGLIKYSSIANMYKIIYAALRKGVPLDNLKQFEFAKTLLIIDKCLRYLKMSYGFVNSILLIVLVKPLHEPLLKFLKKFSESMKKLIKRT